MTAERIAMAKLTKYEKETIVLFNEGEDTAHIQTYNAGLRNADEKQARTPSKTVSSVRRNNVAFRVDMRSKCRVCIRCFDRKYIGMYKVSNMTKM